jgi:hypothetical protein
MRCGLGFIKFTWDTIAVVVNTSLSLYPNSKIRLIGKKCEVILITLSFCYLCNMKTLTKPCPTCNKPTCKNCMKDFPFSDSACLECAASIKTGLGGTRKDEEIF